MKNIKISFKDREVVNYNQRISGEKKNSLPANNLYSYLNAIFSCQHCRLNTFWGMKTTGEEKTC